MSNTCQYSGCKSIHPVFGNKGGRGRFCAEHRLPEMIDVRNARCKHPLGCDKQGTFGIIGQLGAYCVMHKTADMVDLRHAKCGENGCKTRPNFGNIGEKATKCSQHKTAGMVNLTKKQCNHDGCEMCPNYGIIGTKTPIFCSNHKTDDMVDVRHRTCEFLGCRTRPSFGNNNEIPRFCSEHRALGMVDVNKKKCQFPKCGTKPSFGYDIGNEIFCKTHKSNDMINVTSRKTCSHIGCNKYPTYGPGGSNNAITCLSHKEVGFVDVKHKMCEHIGCKSRVYYGIPGFAKSRCSQHRLAGMIRRPNSKCKYCREFAVWGVNWIPIHCDTHKNIDDVNLVERECVSCNLMYILDSDNKCENCNPSSFETTRLAKQNGLMEYLNAIGLEGDSTDTIINLGECGKERPDRVFDFGDKILILEVDENQHRERQCVCEQTRMVNIGQSFGGVPVYFIRWNPDDYSPENENKFPEIISKRYKLVGELIISIRNGKTLLPNALVSSLYMYYDGWASLADEEWIILSKFE